MELKYLKSFISSIVDITKACIIYPPFWIAVIALIISYSKG